MFGLEVSVVVFAPSVFVDRGRRERADCRVRSVTIVPSIGAAERVRRALARLALRMSCVSTKSFTFAVLGEK